MTHAVLRMVATWAATETEQHRADPALILALKDLWKAANTVYILLPSNGRDEKE